MAEQSAVVVSDHEIDLVDAEKDDDETGKDPEIRREVDHAAEDKVLGDPDHTGEEEYGITDPFPRSEESPHPKLPENKQPLQQSIRIGDSCIAGLAGPNEVITDRFSRQPGKGHKEKGLIGHAKTAETNQPRDAG
jgi:hypothetical protein